MIVGFTGTREGMTREQASAFLDVLVATPKGTWLHHGCCVGADEDAHWIAFELGLGLVGHPPTDTKLQMHIPDDRLAFDELRKPKPYLDRNRDIVDACDLLIACPKDTSGKGGTWHTIRYAAQRMKPVKTIWPDGTVTDS